MKQRSLKRRALGVAFLVLVVLVATRPEQATAVIAAVTAAVIGALLSNF